MFGHIQAHHINCLEHSAMLLMYDSKCAMEQLHHKQQSQKHKHWSYAAKHSFFNGQRPSSRNGRWQSSKGFLVCQSGLWKADQGKHKKIDGYTFKKKKTVVSCGNEYHCQWKTETVDKETWSAWHSNLTTENRKLCKNGVPSNYHTLQILWEKPCALLAIREPASDIKSTLF